MNYLLKIKPLPKKDYPNIKILNIDIISSIAHCCSFAPGSTVAFSYCPRGSAVTVLCSNWSPNLEKSAVATGLEKINFIPIARKGNAKEHSNYHTIALIVQDSKVMLKILQVSFSSM